VQHRVGHVGARPVKHGSDELSPATLTKVVVVVRA
jgi:hypothetical protein